MACTIARRLDEEVDSTGHAGFRRLVRPAVLHLIRHGCRDCGRTLAALAATRDDLAPEVPWIEQWPVEPEDERTAKARARKLVSLPAGRRRMYLLSLQRACSRPLVEELIVESRGLLSTDSDRAVEIAELALLCADSIEPERYDDDLVFDLQAKALAHLSNALRRAGDFHGAADAIEEAEAALSLGTSSPEIVGFIRGKRGQLLADQGDLESALEEMSSAVGTLGASELAPELGIALFQRSAVLGALDRNDEAISDLHAALTYLDFEADPRLGFVVTHSLALRYQQAGELDRALVYLDRSTRLWSHAMNTGDHIRAAWARGRICSARGDLDAARAEFAIARDGFLALDYPLDAALVTLELAVTLAEQGRYDDVAELASEILATFRAVGVPREATAAVYLLRSARTVAAVREVAATLTRLKSSGPLSGRAR